jgi:hypothetical protein
MAPPYRILVTGQGPQWRENVHLGPYSEGAGVHKSVVGFVAQIRSHTTKNCCLLRSWNRPHQGGHEEHYIFLTDTMGFSEICFDCGNTGRTGLPVRNAEIATENCPFVQTLPATFPGRMSGPYWESPSF